MESRWLLIVAMATLPACAGDAIAVVARLERSEAGAPAVGGGGTSSGGAGMGGGTSAGFGPFMPENEDAVLGPGSVYWSLYSVGGGASAEWNERPTREAVAVRAVSPENLRAGLQFQFPDAELRDLSKFNKFELDLEVYEGDLFELFLGSDLDHGCSYVIQKGATTTYSSSLASPAWCIPTQCGFDLKVRGGLFLAHVPKSVTLSAKLTDLKFYLEPGAVPAGRASAMDGSSGPNGYCWFLATWNDAIAAWGDTNPTSTGAHVRARASGDGVAGMAFEIPENLHLSQYRTLSLDAQVSDGSGAGSTTFLVQAVHLDRGLGWEWTGDGKRRPYRIDLTNPSFPFSKGTNPTPFDLDSVSRIEIVTQTGGGEAKLDAKVFAVTFEK